MEFVHVSINDGVAEARLKRGKVNALNEPVVEEIADCFPLFDPRFLAPKSTG
jgi:enoyl-CoA hydratase/carnithine racemase